MASVARENDVGLFESTAWAGSTNAGTQFTILHNGSSATTNNRIHANHRKLENE